MRNLFLAASIVAVLGTPVISADYSAQAANSKATASGKSPTARVTKRAKISEAQAIQMISRRPEVRTWKRGVDSSKTKGVSGHVALDRIENGEYVVHVYEEVPDPESSHTATMNWYYVNMHNGKVRVEF